MRYEVSTKYFPENVLIMFDSNEIFIFIIFIKWFL